MTATATRPNEATTIRPDLPSGMPGGGDVVPRFETPANGSGRKYAGKHVRPRRFKWLKRIALLLTMVLLAGAAYVGYTVYQFQSIGRFHIRRDPSLTSPPDTAASGTATSTPAAPVDAPYTGPTAPITFLLLGSDTRGGHNDSFVDKSAKRDGQGGGGSDAIIVLRIDPVSKKTQMLSIHRDLRIDIPGHGTAKINSALVDGAKSGDKNAPPDPSVSVAVVEKLTGVHIDHVAIVDFQGFSNLTDAAGGVTLCLEHAERDKWTGLDLPAGCTHASGEQALSYARSRHTWINVDGKWVHDTEDDFSRIRRQQAFLKALAKQLAEPSMLARLPELAGATKGNLWIDDGVDIMSMISLARHMSNALDNVVTSALPVYNVQIGGVDYVQMNEQAAAPVLKAFREGTIGNVEIKEARPAAGTPVPGNSSSSTSSKKKNRNKD